MTFRKIMESAIQVVAKNITETFKLLWSFKWYVGLYLIYYFLCISLFFEIPEADDPIFRAEATSQLWYYTNQEVYVGSLKMKVSILSFLFLLGTSNMRNHPKIAKFIFILPWICAAMRLITLFKIFQVF